MNSAFLRCQEGTITGILSANDHGDRDEVLLSWLSADDTDMIVRAPIEVARKVLFQPVSFVLEEIGIPQ